MKISLCIRGGGVKSAVAVGVLKAMEESGIEIAGFSGTSIGSVIAALAAYGKTSDEICSLLKKYVILYSNATRIRGGDGESSIIENTINNECNNITFSELDNNLFITANSGGLLRTMLFVFSKETTPNITLGQACRASCSFPGLFRRCKIIVNGKKKHFLDGGMILNPYIPPKEENRTSVFLSFKTPSDTRKSYYSTARLQPEKNADRIIKPYVGFMKTLGDTDDVTMAMRLGYCEAIEALWKNHP